MTLFPWLTPGFAVTAIALCSGCAGPKAGQVQSGIISQPTKFGFDNFTVVEIDPGREQTVFVWRSYKCPPFFDQGYDSLTVASGTDLYEVNDDNLLNNELRVNGKVYRFDGFTEKQRLRIRVGEDIDVVDGGHFEGGKFSDAPNSK
jgi:hypothetical protein